MEVSIGFLIMLSHILVGLLGYTIGKLEHMLEERNETG